MLRPLFVGLLGCAACATSPSDDPQGTYHVAITLRSLQRDVLPPSLDFPSPLSWPPTTDLTVQIDAGDAKVHLLGQQAQVVRQTTVVSSQGWVDPLLAPLGSLYLRVVTASPLVRVDDLVACPYSPGLSDSGNEFELFLFDGQVRGSTANVVSCYWPDGDPRYGHDAFEGVILDVTGERVAR